MDHWDKIEGSPVHLGETWIPSENAFNFAIYSKHAEHVSLLFFTEENLNEPVFVFQFEPHRNKTAEIWHCRISAVEIEHAKYYAYQIDGPPPEAPFERHAFDPEKLLFDPYSRNIFFPPDFDREIASRPGPNMGRAPLSVLQSIECVFNWENDEPIHHTSDLIIYEMHVRGFTNRDNSGVSEDAQGTFAGVIEKIPYLKELGITAVELMPVFQFDTQDGNYWGYMPLGFFAAHDGFCMSEETCERHIEFCEMVKALHSAGIEVILDVVYNHTGEGNESGPTYCFKGIDNTTYYSLTGQPESPFANYSGAGNTLHTSNRAVRKLIVDSLHFWAKEMHVDGFRFDLASILTRKTDGSIEETNPSTLGQIGSDTSLADRRFIAEPWDAGGGFQLGSRFPGHRWMQWNAAYRDTLQQFVRGDEGHVADLMTRLYGSSDLFPDDCMHALRPYQSVNYITSHDGFSLYDMVSYNEKRNWANGHHNTDGTHDYSWNCGCEGEADVSPEVMTLRKQQVKNFFCLLMISNGSPMFRMGDEFLQTQGGNNNPYNQDNETSWLDWSRLDTHRDIFRFVKRIIAFRKSHSSLCRSHFWREDIHWYGKARDVDLSTASKALAFCLQGAEEKDNDIYVMINAAPTPGAFGIHEGTPSDWKRIVDTSLPNPQDILELEEAKPLSTAQYNVQGRSVVVLIRNPQ
ncbi:glycogen debranching protein [Gimesia aquarii]|uniref:Glycogen debranching enzyme n=1 Tax=Gimesia aquarii TaxID=2527964 RepID=A0A517WWY1_9PLAN|nr:isoamylase [Gimesia aquarii]QDU09786.1 Glycogen debranching enzyme [Gimesia aquarii]